MTTRRASTPVTATQGTVNVPEWVAPAMDLPRLDYVDCFQMAAQIDRTAEQWARALFGDEADAVQRFLWVGLLGLKVQRGASARLVAGWPIDTASREEIRLVTGSPGLDVNLVVRCCDGTVALATALVYRQRLPGLRWTLLSAVHRMLAPRLLRDAAAHLSGL